MTREMLREDEPDRMTPAARTRRLAALGPVFCLVYARQRLLTVAHAGPRIVVLSASDGRPPRSTCSANCISFLWPYWSAMHRVA